MIKTTNKKQAIVPKLTNLTSTIEIQQPLSCRSSKSTYISFIQNAHLTSRQKENNIKFTKTSNKSQNNSINNSKNVRLNNNSSIQSSLAILNALNQNIKQRNYQQQSKNNNKSNSPTTQKQQEQQFKFEKNQILDNYSQLSKQKKQIKFFQCFNHKDKKAKFYNLNIINNEKQYLCSYCAIQEAYEVPIYIIKTNQVIPKKFNQWTLGEFEYPENSEESRKVEQLTQFLKLAKQLYESAKIKNDDYQKQNNYEIEKEIEIICTDIISNAKSIINNVESKSFKMILQNYVNRLQQFDIILNKKIEVKKHQLKNQQVLISFQNKDSFMCQQEDMESADSLTLRQSETKHFLDDYNDVTLYSPNF